MKVLIGEPSGGAFWYITKSFLNSFNDAGIKAQYWNGRSQKDFERFNPDLYIGCSGHRQEVPDKRRCKVAIHVNPYGDRLEPILKVDINEPPNAIKWTQQQRPDAVFGYGHQSDSLTYWKDWNKKLGIPWIGVPTAGDATIYYPDKKQVNYKVAFLGGRWEYKGHNIDKWLLPVIKTLGNEMAIHGWGGWQQVKSYRGPLPRNESGRQFLSSALVCPCICEPHTTVYGIDIPERFFKAALCGSLPILDKVPGFGRYCDNYLMAQTPAEYKEMILEFIKEEFQEKRVEKAKLIRNEVLSKHTYHHRMRDLCSRMGLSEAAERLDAAAEKLV